MKKTLAFIIFLLFLLLAWFSWGWYKSTVACCEKEEIVIVEYGPLIFDCTTKEAITNDGWSERKSKILALRRPNKKLFIVAPYFNNEDESHGMARARNIQKLFTSDLEINDIELGVRAVGDCEKLKEKLLHGARFKWVTRNEDVVEHFDKTLVYYHYDSTQEVPSENISNYFNELANLLKSSKDMVKITGHTDADGDADYNLQLGLDRANEFKSRLVALGINEDQIQVDSKGKSMPISDNDTPEGKQKNRRVEIQIIKN